MFGARSFRSHGNLNIVESSSPKHCSSHTTKTCLDLLSLQTSLPPELIFLFMLANDPSTFPIFKKNKNRILDLKMLPNLVGSIMRFLSKITCDSGYPNHLTYF